MRSLFTHLFKQLASVNQTNETVSRDYRKGVISWLSAGHLLCATYNRGTTRFFRLAAMVTLLLTLACGNMWGADHLYFWFSKAGDATTNSVTNNENSFFGSTPSGSSSASGSVTIDGTTYTITQRSSNSTPSITFTIPANKTGKLYAIVQGSSSRSVQLKQGGTTIQSITWENSVASHDFNAVGAGTYTITSSGNVGWCMLAVKVSDAASTKRIYMKAGAWNTDSPYFYAHSWGSSNNDVLMTLADCETDVFYADIPSGNTSVLFTRQSTNAGIKYKGEAGNWNQSDDITISTNDKFTFNSWDGGSDGKSTFTSGTYSAPTYTISFAANGGSGSMSSISSIACGDDQALPANTFTKSGYVFDGWKADVAVTIGGSSVAAGTKFAGGSTLQNITSNITLTAQWEENSCPSDGTLYSLTVKSATYSVPATTETNMVSDYATVSGGGAYIGNKNGSAGKAQVTTTGSGTVYFNGADGYLKLVLDCPIQTGDVLTFTNGSGSNQICFTTTNSRSTDYTTVSNSYTFPAAFNNVSTIYVWRTSGSSTYLHDLTITRSSSCTAPTALAAASTTAKGTTFTVTDGANTNDYEFYVSTSSTAPTSGSSATYTSTSKTKTITDCVAGTTYYAWVRSKCDVSSKSEWTALTGNTFTTSTVTVTHTLTNVTKTSGAATAGGSDYTAVYAAVSGYSLPTPTVTIDGNTATSGTDYTWTAGTGTLTIPANKINGNIVITLNSAAAAPSSVAIGDNWLWFAGETMTLTATPTGGNGPVTYQWYKGGKADGNAIDGATDATFSKTCAFEDAGSYYCKVTCGGTESTWGKNGDAYDVKVPRLYVKTGRNDGVKSDYGNVDFTRVDASTATASISLGSNWDYCFNIADGCGHYYGNAGTMQYNNYGPWVTNVNNQDCGLRTTNGATYVFTINYSNWAQLTTTVTFPSSNQAADKVIYFDNNDRQWSNLHYRIGRGDHTQAAALTLVPGTANLYKYTTVAYNNFAGWHIANNSGWTGSNTIYRTYTNGDQYSITYATAHEGGAVTQAAVTVTPTTSRGAGSDAGINDNCTFYNYEITTGMKTQNVSITAPSNGTITVSYTDVNNAAQSFTSGNADLAHTVIITPTVTPATGYQLSGLTVNGNAHTPGNTYTVIGTTVVAATFSLIDYTVTLHTNGGTINAGNVTSYNYGTGATLPTNVTKSGYSFDGWYDNSGLTGDAVTTISSSATGNKEFWAKWTCATPTFGTNLSTSTVNYSVGDAASALTVAATAGGGTVTYQWYKNTANSTTTPTPTALTTGASYTPSTAAAGTTYYFCVATNSTAGCSTTATSNITPVTVTQTYTVSYNYNGATSGASPASATAASVTLPTPTRTSYVLDGWYTTAGTKVGDGGDTYNLTADITLYAKWYANCAGGDSEIYSTDVLSSPASPATKTSNTGTFNTSATAWSSPYSNYMITDGSAGYYQLNFATPLSLTGYTDVKLKVYWGAGANRPLKLSINGGSNTTIDEVASSSDRSKLRSIETEISVSSISSLKLISDGGGQVYLFRIEISGTAISGGTCYHVDYDGNGATSGFINDTTAYASGDAVTVLGNGGRYPYTKVGYEIVGWADTKVKADAGTIDYEIGSTFDMPSSDKTLYAVWSNEFTITYHLNGASWADAYVAPSGYEYGTGASLPIASNMINTGYTFNGWYDNEELSGDAITVVGSSETGDKEFWAKWTENTYDVTYNANGGSGTTAAQNGHYVTLRDNGFTAPSGKTFVEWNTATDGSGASYNEGEEVELKADLALYAIWADDYTITWGDVQIGGAGATVTPNLGGGNYTITANVASWTGTLTTSMISTETAGVTITNVAVDNTSSPKTITATFNVGASVAGESITLTLNVPAAGVYGAKSSEKEIDIERCEDGTILYSMHLTAYNSYEVNSTYGGSCSLGSFESGSTVTANGHTHYKSSGTLLTATLKSGLTFQAGDSLVLYMTASKDTKTTGYKICQSAGNSATVLDVTKSMASGTEYNVTSKLTAAMTTIVGVNTIRIDRHDGDARFYGIDIIRPSGGGGSVPTSLSWSGGLADGGQVTKDEGVADFTYTASTTSNTLGAITYTSSDAHVTVSSTGKVHIGSGINFGGADYKDITITANLAESGCYESASITYTLRVNNSCEDIAGTISTENLGCDGIRMTVTGHTAEAGVTYQWYKDGVSLGSASGAQTTTYTATTAGEYYVVVTNTGVGHCAMVSANTVVIEAQAAATATKIVDEWYVKNGRRTPDIALVQTENADNFQVKSGETVIWSTVSDSEVTTGFGGCGFYLGEDGIIYLKGIKNNGDATSGLTAGDEVLTFIAKACGGDASKDITIHKQAATDRASVAYVSLGTEKGEVTDTTAGYYKTAPLYIYLDHTLSGGAFDLTARNIYWSVNEQKLREHYSQFDAIVITDDPNTGKKKDGKSYVDAMGALIDIRPMLTMEAWVSGLANWKAKGIDGNPTSPNPRQYAMTLECKDHEIFAGLDPASVNVEVTTEGGIDYWTVAMVDSTKSPYRGVADDSETSDKPALQGFSASDVSGLLLLGEISEGSLYAGVERQEKPAARLMLLGLNAKALPNALTTEGKTVIKNAITYLLKTNMEDVDDCSNYFTGATSTDWNTASNWFKNTVPNSPTTKVRILAPCEVGTGGPFHAASIDIATSGTSGKKAGTCNGSLTIAANGALIVGGKIRSAEAPYFNTGDLKPTAAADLVLNTSSTNQAALVFNNDKGDTKATVNLYSLGRKESGAYQFQYMAVPMNYIDVNPAFAGSGIYTYVWKEPSNGWERRAYYAGLSAFEGVGITTKSGSASNYTLQGALTSTTEKAIQLTTEGSGQNIIGNSWTAPIDIASLRTALVDDDNIVDKTIYIYCAGNDGASVHSGATETAGQWLAIPIEAAAWGAWGGLKVIPAMQAFCIKANTGTTLTLNYKDHVRSTASAQLNQPLRAPKREAEQSSITLTNIRVADSKTHTDLYLFEGEKFSEEFDNGWEAKYMSGDGRSAKLYAETEIGKMAVVALPELEGTILGFAPGKETEYTFSFSGAENGYYLNDLKLKQSTLIEAENSYNFTFEEGDTNRFYISRTPIDKPEITTDVENAEGEALKPHKILYNDKLYILFNGRVFDATGKVVK